VTDEIAPRVTEEEVLRRPGSVPDEQRAYGPGTRRFGDLRLPPGDGPHPVAVLVHGGCWADVASLRYMDGLAVDLTRAGWATWNVEFRRLGDPGGGWPATFRDVAAAADFVRVLARGLPLDLQRVVSIGHSSGGHLALWLAARHRLDPGTALFESTPLRMRGAVALAGIADLLGFHELPDRSCLGRVEELLGADPASVRDRVRMASPAELLPLGVRQLLVVGENDRDVPASHVEAYARRARAEGDDVRYVEVAGAGHFEVVAPWWPRWREVREPLVSFLADGPR
jgi:acetyl esterase/lipase